MDTLDIYDAFSQEPFFNGNEEPIKVTPDNVHSLLPQLLSVSSIKKRVFNLKTPEDLRPPTKIYLKQKLKDMDKMDTETIKKNLIQAKSLVKLLKPDRADNYNTWWDIGIILFNIGQGCDEAFKIWDKWSSKSDNYDEDACLEVWGDMEKRKSYGTKGMGSLKYYARVDNPQGYTQLVESMHGLDLNQDFVRTKILTTDAPLARLLLDIYSGEYIFSDVGWYRFNGTIWLPIKVLQNFRYKLEAVAAKYAQFHTKIIDILYPDQDDTQDSGEGSSDNDSSDDDDDKHKLTKKSKVILSKKLTEINRAINKLENFASQTGVLKMCEVLFYDENFYDQLDQNPQLIAFKNGVFDLETLTFRDGLQTDYLSKTLGVEYKQVDDSSIQKLKSFFEKIFPDASVRKYFIEQSCELFRGGNRDKIAMFWTGTGNNGKSVTQKLFETMIGKKLAIKLSTSVLTDRIQPGQPNPQITRLRGSVRWGVFDEIRKSEQIDCGSLKLLTGGDSLPCRDLFQRGQDSDDFTPMFKFLCICNQLPALKDVDDATWERIRIIPFESKFVSKAKCPKTIQEQEQRKMFLCDTEITLPKRMEELAEALGWYLIQVLKEKEERRRNGTYESIIPDKVNEAKLQYQIKCDLLLNFMEDTYIKTGDDKHKMTFDQMFVSFRAWYTDSFVDKKIPFNKQEFIEVIKNKHGLLQSDKVLKGYIYNRKCDDSDSDNE
ncbi:DNA primase [Chloriridovirus anopheles1]|uniref:Putative helicase n=1 Tax=Chloriridovirus anopheles1 TaxID=1465751 RepID=W8QRB7_9VIRU|nr:DNA primase [Anopheles minimus iridovirus]AHL67522.1 putative helicase [Anopheles minimus iridovirus]